MKKIQLLSTVLFTLTLGLVSCTSDHDSVQQVNADSKNVFIKIQNEQTSSTYADSPSGFDQAAVLTKGVVVFVTGDEITRYVNIATTGATSYTPSGDATIPVIEIATIKAGLTFGGIKADRVYIIGNRTADKLVGLPLQNAEGVVASGSKLSTLIKSSLLDVTESADMSNGTFDNVPLFGWSMLTGSGTEYTTTVDLKPVVARLEVKKVGGKDIEFDLVGMFVNNYNSKAQMNGELAAGNTLINHSYDVTKYVAAYHATALMDWNTAGLGTSTGGASTTNFTVNPITGVWGYNVFAASGKANVPHLVLRLRNVKNTEGNPVAGTELPDLDRFVTVKGFFKGSEEVIKFVPGYIYTVTNISFSEINTTDLPEIQDRVINATVTVKVAKWIDGGEFTPDI